MNLNNLFDKSIFESIPDGKVKDEQDPDMSFSDFVTEAVSIFNHLQSHEFKADIQIRTCGLVELSVYPKDSRVINIFSEWSTQSALELKAMDAKINHIIKTMRAK